MKSNLIIHSITSSVGANEYSSVEMIADTKTGETELVVTKTIRESYPITDYDKVMQLHANLNRGGGRKKWSLEDLTK